MIETIDELNVIRSYFEIKDSCLLIPVVGYDGVLTHLTHEIEINVKGPVQSGIPIKKVNRTKNTSAILQLDVDTGEQLGVFKDAAEAGRYNDCDGSNILKCCREHPRYKTSGGYKWVFGSNGE